MFIYINFFACYFVRGIFYFFWVTAEEIFKTGFVAKCVPQIIQNNQMTHVSVLSVTHLITICLIVTH